MTTQKNEQVRNRTELDDMAEGRVGPKAYRRWSEHDLKRCSVIRHKIIHVKNKQDTTVFVAPTATKSSTCKTHDQVRAVNLDRIPDDGLVFESRSHTTQNDLLYDASGQYVGQIMDRYDDDQLDRTGDRYRCQGCGEAFESSDDLLFHTSNLHSFCLYNTMAKTKDEEAQYAVQVTNEAIVSRVKKNIGMYAVFDLKTDDDRSNKYIPESAFQKMRRVVLVGHSGNRAGIDRVKKIKHDEGFVMIEGEGRRRCYKLNESERNTRKRSFLIETGYDAAATASADFHYRIDPRGNKEKTTFEPNPDILYDRSGQSIGHKPAPEATPDHLLAAGAAHQL